MIVELKEKLKPNTYVYYDGKNLISVSRDELLGDIDKKIAKLEGFHESLMNQQKSFEKKLSERFKRFLSIFQGGKK